MSKKILLLNFDKRSRARFENTLVELGGEFSVEEIHDPKEIEQSEEKITCVFYLHTKNSEELARTVRELRKAQTNIPVNVVFKKRDFEALMSAFELSLHSVLDRGFMPGELEKALRKCDLRNIQTSEFDIPVKSLLDLLSGPIKVKSDRDLYRQLYTYFKSFSENIEFSLYQISEEENQLVEGPQIDSREAFEKMREFKLPKIFIGKNFEMEIPGKGHMRLFPVYENDGVQTWCVCRLEKEKADFILNNVFFRYLENVLIFRKNLGRVSEYLDLANKDDVTGLYNQRKLIADLAETIEYHEALEKTFSIMFIDVDHFKKVNDNFGHIVGSQMLTEIGKELQGVLRSTDKIYRYGGDEFVVLMPEVTIQMVHKIAVRVRETVKQKSFNVGEAKNYQLSLSIGIAEYPTDAKTAKEIIEFADSMMYASKKSGRGKVFHVGEVQDDIAGSK